MKGKKSVERIGFKAIIFSIMYAVFACLLSRDLTIDVSIRIYIVFVITHLIKFIWHHFI